MESENFDISISTLPCPLAGISCSPLTEETVEVVSIKTRDTLNMETFQCQCGRTYTRAGDNYVTLVPDKLRPSPVKKRIIQVALSDEQRELLEKMRARA